MSGAKAGHTFQQVLDETRGRFVATFAAQCDAIGALVDDVTTSGASAPAADLTHVIHRLSGFAGTIGFPTVSARASELEDIVEGAGRGAFDGSLARGLVDAIRKALDEDLARPPVRLPLPPPAVRGPRGAGSVPLRILIVDDHAIVRHGLRALLSDEFRGAVFGDASDARQAVEQLRNSHWDVALLDVTLPGKNGLELLKDIKVEWPMLPVLVLSGHTEDQFAIRVLRAGAGGYITKASAPEELAKAIHKIADGGRYVSDALAEKLAMGVTKDPARTPHETLSDREYDVMSRIASGMTVTEIGEELSLSVKTISTYRARVLEKLGVRNSAEIVQYAIRNGLMM